MKSAVLALASLLFVGHVVMGDPQMQEKLTAAIFDFSQKLHLKIFSDKPSGVFSPVGVHSVLTMTSNGAKNETAKEMIEVLKLSSLPGSDAHDTYQEMILELKSQSELTYGAPKGILVHPNSPIEPDFKNDVEVKYLSKVNNFELNAPGGPEKEMNEYIAKGTNYWVKDIIANGSVSNDTSLLLVSAFVFNATFQDQFKKNWTSKHDFFKQDGTTSKVDMMNDTRSVLLKRNNQTGIEVVQIPFKGGRFSIYLVVSKQKEGISELEKKLAQSGNVTDLFEGLSPNYVQLSIPKFRIESSHSLTDVIKDMGMLKAVTPLVADFRGISKTGNIHISRVLHNAIIDIKESGAVTEKESVEEDKPSRPVDEASEIFKVDRPFVFFVRDDRTKMLLAQGKFSG